MSCGLWGPELSKLSVRRGSKKHQALLALLEVAKKRSIVTFEELISEMSAPDLSKSYIEDLLVEELHPLAFSKGFEVLHNRL
jgi:hypothetical protein